MNTLQQLILWRHAEAEDQQSGQTDLERALTARGRKQAARMGRWLDARLPADTHVITSPALRAQHTAAGLQRPVQVMDQVAPVAAAADLWQAVVGCGATTVLLVGHQPSLGQLAAWLLSGEEQSWSVKKGGIWWFEIAWRGPHPTAKLLACVTADLL